MPFPVVFVPRASQHGVRAKYMTLKTRYALLVIMFVSAITNASDTTLSPGMTIKWHVNVIKHKYDPTGKSLGDHSLVEYQQTDINKILGDKLRFDPLGIACVLKFETGANSWEKMGLKSKPNERPWYSERLNFLCVIDKKITVTATRGVSCSQEIGRNNEILPDQNHIEIHIKDKGYFAVHVFCGPK